MGTYANFYNSVDGDRQYDASSFEEWIRPFFKTGVFEGSLQVTSNGDMTITVNPGYVNINGKMKHFESALSLTIGAASGIYKRIDNIVVRRDDAARDFVLAVVPGTMSDSPTAPLPQRDSSTYELVLAHVLIGVGATAITTDDITDTRLLSDVCGYVASTITEIDFTQIQKQFDAYLVKYKDENLASFETWFAAMKDQLTTDAAGHLQTEIDAKKLKIKTLTVPHASVVANTDAYATATPPFPYCYDFALAEITDNTVAKVKPQTDADYASFIKYANGANYTSAGSIRIYFKKQPTEDLNVKIEYAEGTVM